MKKQVFDKMKETTPNCKTSRSTSIANSFTDFSYNIVVYSFAEKKKKYLFGFKCYFSVFNCYIE